MELPQTDEMLPLDSWAEHTSFIDEAAAVSAIEYDHVFDMILFGHANGRLSTYSLLEPRPYQDSDNDVYSAVPELLRYSSCHATRDMIGQILCNQNFIISVGQRGIGMTAHGGTSLGAFSIAKCMDPSLSEADAAAACFTCADLLRDSTIPRGSSSYMASHIITGASNNAAYLFDLNSGIDVPVMAYDIGQPVAKVLSNGFVMTAGCSDGAVRVLDGKFRSQDVLHSIEAHSGPVRDMCLLPDGRTLLTCGAAKRSLNPYDPNSPYQYVSDPLIRAFDLRTQRQLSALPITMPPASAHSTSGVGFLKFVPEIDLPAPSVSSSGRASLLLCTDNGLVQFSSFIFGVDGSDASPQQFYAPLSDPASECVTAAAVSSSGQFAAVGTSSGAVGQYLRRRAHYPEREQMERDLTVMETYRVNEASPSPKPLPSYWAEQGLAAPKPMLSLPPDALVLGTAYVLRVPPIAQPKVLSSSFETTPAVLKRKLRLTSSKKINPELRNKMTKQDFIGSIRNPGYLPNSLLSIRPGQLPTKDRSVMAPPPFPVCDPRRAGNVAAATTESAFPGAGAAGVAGMAGMPGSGVGAEGTRSGRMQHSAEQGQGDGEIGIGGGDLALTSSTALLLVRLREQQQQQQQCSSDATGGVLAGSLAALSLEGRGMSRTPSPMPTTVGSLASQGGSRSVSPMPTMTAIGAAAAFTAATGELLPRRLFRKLSSVQQGSKRFKKFDYDALNSTPFLGLENKFPFAHVNPVLLLLYHLPPLRQAALHSQLIPLHHKQTRQFSLICELGFLFHMLHATELYFKDINDEDRQHHQLQLQQTDQAEQQPGSVSAPVPVRAPRRKREVSGEKVEKVVRPANFVRILQSLSLHPDALAMGLFEPELQRDPQRLVQVLIAFVLKQIKRELDDEAATSTATTSSAPSPAGAAVLEAGGRRERSKKSNDDGGAVNVVEALFGIACRSSTTFLVSDTHKVEPLLSKSLLLDLQYPSLTASGSSSKGGSRGGKGSATTAVTHDVQRLQICSLFAGGREAVEVDGQVYRRVKGPRGKVGTSFAAALWESFLKTQQMKGWCKESSSYEPFRKVQSLVSLPQMLTVQCGNTRAGLKDNSTLGGAIGDTPTQLGNAHQNFWNHPVFVAPTTIATTTTSTTSAAHAADESGTATGSLSSSQAEPGVDDPAQVQIQNQDQDQDQDQNKNQPQAQVEWNPHFWTPVELEIAFLGESEGPQADSEKKSSTSESGPPASVTSQLTVKQHQKGHNGTKLVISCRCLPLLPQSPAAALVETLEPIPEGDVDGHQAKDHQSADERFWTGRGGGQCVDGSVWVIYDGTAEFACGQPASRCGVWDFNRVNGPVPGEPAPSPSTTAAYVRDASGGNIADNNPATSSTTLTSTGSDAEGAVSPTRPVEVIPAAQWVVERFDLAAMVSLVQSSNSSTSSSNTSSDHLVLHLREGGGGGGAAAAAATKVTPSQDSSTTSALPTSVSPSSSQPKWHLFNDFLVHATTERDVLTFPDWRHPCIVCFRRQTTGISKPTSTPTSAPIVVRAHQALEVTRSENATNTSATSISNTEASAQQQLLVENELDQYRVPESVLQLESLSQVPSIRLLRFNTALPGPGDLIAFDGEFVSVSAERSVIGADGQRQVSEEVWQVLARMSLLDMGRNTSEGAAPSAAAAATAVGTGTGSGAVGGPGEGRDGAGLASAAAGSVSLGSGASSFNKNMMRILADDYILPVEPVVDYVTRFSGITPDDLDPQLSKHAVVTQRAAYLKLRYFIDRKCIFVGHGLQKDFETANIFIPPEQVRDTVDLWRLPNQRKISLRFLASYVLQEDIQDEIHDSIEDAKTALLLYRRYEDMLAEKGPAHIHAFLQQLYQYGNRTNWTIGIDRLQQQQQQR